jgi:hypothetical protein
MRLATDVLPPSAHVSSNDVSRRAGTAAAALERSSDGRKTNDGRSPQAAPPQVRGHRVLVREEVAVRLSVIDGADRMLYSDLRDRKGWEQPLSVQQVLKDARGQQRVGLELPPPKLVRALERGATSEKGEPSSTARNAYQAGKSGARGGRPPNALGVGIDVKVLSTKFHKYGHVFD